MKIVSLKVQNFQCLKCVEITPSGAVIQLSGKNGAGKSSVLDAICAALQGGKATKVAPIREGETRAEIIAETEKWVAKRVFTPKGTQLVVSTPDGQATFASPQTLLDQVWSELTFDPLDFLRRKPAEQYQLLMHLVGLDFADLDGQRQTLYDERTLVNREVKRLQVTLEQLPPPMETLEDGTPLQEIDLSALLKHKDEAVKAQYAYTDYTETCEKLEATITTLREDLREAEAAYAAVTDKPVMKPDDQAHLTETIMLAESANEQIRAQRARNADHAAAVQAVEEAQARSMALTDQIVALDVDKRTQIESSTFPLDGLTVGHGIVYYRGLPMEQISTGQGVRVSTAMAMAMNPALKVLFIRNGSNLDTEGLHVVAELAEQHGYQVWIEQVDESGTVGIYLEDGMIHRDNTVGAQSQKERHA